MSFSSNRVRRLFHLYVRAATGLTSTAAATWNPASRIPLVSPPHPANRSIAMGFRMLTFRFFIIFHELYAPVTIGERSLNSLYSNFFILYIVLALSDRQQGHVTSQPRKIFRASFGLPSTGSPKSENLLYLV